jgi:hypothetical protein
MTKPTIQQLDPQGNWREFSRLHPAAAREINVQAREISAYNRQVDQERRARLGSLKVFRWNDAAQVRQNIVEGRGRSLWGQISREWAGSA